MPSSKKNSKNWSGRFNEPVDELVQRYTASISFDHVLAPYDIKGSLAHAQMLQEKKIISKKDFSDIKKGMSQISSEISSGSFKWSIEKEDIHLNIEHRLTQLIGDAGKKLHTARSRNDQVATDIRLYLRDVIDEIVRLLSAFQGNLLNLAEKHVDTVMPGFTHLQVAQPVSLGHHLMAYFEMTNRD
ncbi:MAG: lyase family protein, partial [Burkholderiales bacterium]